MGLSRRLFTKEFKLAAVRRLEQGVSIGEAARALEVNPNVLHRWRREFRNRVVRERERDLARSAGHPFRSSRRALSANTGSIGPWSPPSDWSQPAKFVP